MIPSEDRALREQEFIELITRSYELAHFFKTDATVYSWLSAYRKGHCSREEALIGAVVHLAREKKSYFDKLVVALENSLPSSPTLMKPKEK